MRALAAVCCAFAAGCSTSLGITAPGVAHYESRPARPPAAAAPVTRMTLELDRRALSLTAVARTRSETARTGEFRRIQPGLTYGIPYSFVLAHAELVVAAALVPALIPILLYQAAWWIWSRGLPDEERLALASPFGSGYRDASLQALWPGVNVTAWWRWRARLLALDDPAVGGWRERTVVAATPVAGAVRLEAKFGTAAARNFSASADAAGAARWSLAELPAQGDAPLVLTATSGSGTATLEVPAAYWRAARQAAALRATLAKAPGDAASRRALAALYREAGGFALARAHLGRLQAAGTSGIAGELDELWRQEEQAHRTAGRTRAALLAAAIRPLEYALRTGAVSAEPLEAAPEAAAGRITRGLLRERVHNALAWARHDAAPPELVGNALLSAAGDFTAPAAAWAALHACIRHPQPLAGDVLPNLLRAGVPVELQRLAAQAVLAGDPDGGLYVLAEFAGLPGVHWALSDATGTDLPPLPEEWLAWAEAEAWQHQWDAAQRRYTPRRDR